LRQVNTKDSDGSKTIQLRTWRVVLIRNRDEYLGEVKAASLEAAEIAALQAFNLKQEDRKRLLVRERAYYLAAT
jgi:hypothetical protein